MENNHELRLENFSERDFDRLISWVKSEKELIQFAGPVFSFPLTREQLQEYLSDSHRYAFKVVHETTNTTIGHGEVYKTDEQNGRSVCRTCF